MKFRYDAIEAYLPGEKYFDLTLPTSVAASSEVVHPSVIHLADDFAGFRWWMAMTPLPAATEVDFEGFENPEILVSQDGITWTVPPRLTNPIVPDNDPGGDGHNADTYLTLSPDGSELLLVWVEFDAAATPDRERVQLKRSNNGITWGVTTTLLEYESGTERFLSPSLNWDAENTEWVLHGVDIVQSPNVLVRATRIDLDGVFGSRSNTIYTLPSAQTDVWHAETRKLERSWFGIVMFDPAGGAGPIYAIQSRDGISWTFGAKLSIREGYKSALVPIDDGSMALYWGFRSDPDWHIEHTLIRFNRTATEFTEVAFERGATVGAAAKTGRFFLEDSFQRADDLVSLGTTDSGEAWAADAGEWNVLSNQAAVPIAQNNISTIDTGFNDAEFIVEFDVIGVTRSFIVLRLSSTSQFQRIGLNTTSIRFERVGGLGTSVLKNITLPTSTTRKVRVVCTGTKYQIFVDGTFVFEIDDADHLLNTKFGIQCSTTDIRIARVIISKLTA